jgi:hypothetical protein
MKRALITGITGQDGSYLAATPMTAYDRHEAGAGYLNAYNAISAAPGALIE